MSLGGILRSTAVPFHLEPGAWNLQKATISTYPNVWPNACQFASCSWAKASSCDETTCRRRLVSMPSSSLLNGVGIEMYQSLFLSAKVSIPWGDATTMILIETSDSKYSWIFHGRTFNFTYNIYIYYNIQYPISKAPSISKFPSGRASSKRSASVASSSAAVSSGPEPWRRKVSSPTAGSVETMELSSAGLLCEHGVVWISCKIEGLVGKSVLDPVSRPSASVCARVAFKAEISATFLNCKGLGQQWRPAPYSISTKLVTFHLPPSLSDLEINSFGLAWLMFLSVNMIDAHVHIVYKIYRFYSMVLCDKHDIYHMLLQLKYNNIIIYIILYRNIIYSNMIINSKHSKACTSYVKIWNLLEDHATNCSKLALTQPCQSQGVKSPVELLPQGVAFRLQFRHLAQQNFTLPVQTTFRTMANLSLKAWQLTKVNAGCLLLCDYQQSRISSIKEKKKDTTYQDKTYANLPKDANLLALVQHFESNSTFASPWGPPTGHQPVSPPFAVHLTMTMRWATGRPHIGRAIVCFKKKLKPRNGSAYLWLRDPSWLCPTLLPKPPRKLKSVNVTGVLRITYLRFLTGTKSSLVIRVPCMIIQDAEDGMPSWCCVWNRSRTNSS